MRQSWTGFLLAVLISTIAVSGQQGASSGSSAADIVYAQPGQLVSVNGFRLNLYCMGSGSPTVVFDSGWGDWAPAWSKVQPQIAKWTRACSYDRAGTGFSDPGPMPRTSVRIARELRTALHNAGIAGPYILVGSAFGGDNVRTFADLYMGEVAGMVLVDADPTDVEPKAMQEEEHRGLAGIPKDMRECRDLIAEHKPLPVTSRPGRPQQTCAQQFFFRGLPEAEWSPELNAKVLEIAQTKVAMYDAYSSEMAQTAADETYMQQHRRSFGSRPIRVLTSGNHAVGHLERKPPDTPKHVKYEQEITLAQARWLALSSNSKQIFARNSSEYIQFDEPETVINAIREVYEQTRRPKPSTSADQTAKEVILVGELHGTQETPRLFSNLVTVAARENNKRIGVGLELPTSLQRLIDEAVKSNAKIESFREQLLADPAWQKINDGRSSEAMLDLICDTLKLAESQKVSLFFFDTQINDRNETMAQLIGQRVREERYGLTFILTGNIHANKAPRHPRMTKIVPMGYRLQEQGFAVHSYDVGYSEGEAWACTPECGVHHLKSWGITADAGAIHEEGYDGILFVGPIHASPPAYTSLPLKGAQ